MTDVKRWLRPDEGPGLPRSEMALTSLEDRLQCRLAACRVLLKKHEWGFRVVNPDNTRDRFICLECKQDFEFGHTPDCAIATALKGVGGE